jgi:hypothetical protein
MSEPKLTMSPSELEYMLVMAIFKRLMAKFTPTHGDESNRRAVAMLNYAFLMKPGDEPAERYLVEHQNEVLQEFEAIRDDVQLYDAFSLLYSFMLIRIGPTDFERSHALALRASELYIVLRTPEEFCGAIDAQGFLDYIQEYIDRLWHS